MAYNLKYLATYNAMPDIGQDTGVECKVEIYMKDYAGSVLPLELSENPVQQRYEADVTRPIISGCSLILNINNTGSLPITAFYSNEDNTYLIKHYKNNQVTFIGYLVLDDCQELMVDYRHEISLSFNDNLGLLKDVVLNTQDIDTYYTYENVLVEGVSPDTLNFIGNKYTFVIGTTFSIEGVVIPTLNGTYTPTAITPILGGVAVTVAEAVTTEAQFNAILFKIQPLDYYGYNNLLSIIQACLVNTNLSLTTIVFAQIFEENQETSNSFLQQTYVDTQTFLNEDTFKSCWDVLQIILGRFNMSLFQDHGGWCIVRWDEMRYGDMNAFIYDANFRLQGFTSLATDTNFGFEQSSYPVEISAIKSVTRPYKFDKETFRYEQPKYLILNSDLLKLGDFIDTVTVGDFRYDKYQFPASSQWIHFFPGTPEVDTSYIVVVTQISLDREVDRYVYQPKTNTGGVSIQHRAGVQFNDIQVSANDLIQDFSFSIKSASSTGGDAVIWRYGVMLVSDEGNFYTLVVISGILTWNHIFAPPNDNAPALSHTVLAADAETYLDISLPAEATNFKVPPFPVDGVLRIRIYGSNDTNASQPQVDAIWKNIKLSITQIINDNTGIIGQIHTNEQPPDIKNNNEKTIYIDDSPRSSIKGTLFLVSFTELVRHRTSQWFRQMVDPSERLRLGEITTLEELATYVIPRAKIEGTFKGVQLIGPFGRILYTPFNTIRLVAQALEISYRFNSFNGTLYELPYNEPDSGIDNTYTFTYIYNTK